MTMAARVAQHPRQVETKRAAAPRRSLIVIAFGIPTAARAAGRLAIDGERPVRVDEPFSTAAGSHHQER